MLNGKNVTNGVTNGVTDSHAYNDQWEEKLAIAEKAKLRKRKERAKKKIEEAERACSLKKSTFKVQLDGSCIWEWRDGDTITDTYYFASREWTMYCKLMALGVRPITTFIGNRITSIQPATVLEDPDDQWLKYCENDPDRDAVQITMKN
jgi:hypothetical protein